LTLFEALENPESLFGENLGHTTQQMSAYTIAALALASSALGLGALGIVAAVFFLCATVWPAVAGRILAMLTILFSAIIIAMGNTGGDTGIRAVLALGTVPFILVSLLLASERFATVMAVSVLYGFRKLTRKTPFNA